MPKNEIVDQILALLEENRQLARENNAILRKLYKYQKWSRSLRIIYWVAIIGLIIFGYAQLMPYFEELNNTSESVRTSLQEVKNFFTGNEEAYTPSDVLNSTDEGTASSTE